MKKESELRQATILFADISGFTSMSEKMSPEEVTSIMNSVFKMMGDIIEHYGGRIDKFIGDCVMATFGVPIAIENAPNKAVNTAIEMRNKLYEFNKSEGLEIPLDIHIGINSGNVLAGEVGSDQKMEYTVMGDTVNLASRLEDVSQSGQILVGSDTYQSTKDEFEFRDLKPIKLKGKEQPVPVFELVSEKEKIHRRLTTDRMIQSEMVGREKEIDLLALHVLKAKKGEGSIVNVIGEAGIGKSRLIAELKNRDAVRQTTILEGRALSMGRNLGFYPIIEILKGFSGIGENDTESTQHQKLESVIQTIHPEEADEIFPFIATLMGMKLTGTYAERIEGIEGEAMEKLIFKNLRALILKSAELIPLVFIVEDLHWADSSSLDMIISLFRLVDNNRVLIINVFRPHYEETGEVLRKAAIEQFPKLSTEIELHHLDTGQSDLLIDNLLKIEGLPDGIRNRIKESSEGNPFFIEEMIRSMIDDGALTINEGSFRITEKINNVVVPNTIQELLMSRIDRLDDTTKSLLRTASVIGRHFFHKILTEVTDTITDIDDKLGYLKEIQLIREGKRMEEVEYLFKHALAQEATYKSILLQKRKELHLRVAESIERIFSKRLHEFYGMLAYHYSQGEDLDKVEEYMLKAGEEALKSSATSEAISYYRSSLDLYTRKYGEKVEPSKMAEMEKNIAIAYHTRGDYVQAVQYYDKAIARLGLAPSQNKLFLGINLFICLTILLKNIYLPTRRKKKIPTEKEQREFRLILDKNMGLMTNDSKRFFIEMLLAVKPIFSFDITKSQLIFDLFILLAGVFIWSGLNFKFGRKMAQYASKILVDSDRQIQSRLLDVGLMVLGTNSGNWTYAYNENCVRSNLEVGDNQAAAGYQLFAGHMCLGIGDFETIRTIQKSQLEIVDNYNDDHALSDYLEIRACTSLIEKQLNRALEDIKENIILMDKVKQDARKVTFLGLRLQIEVMQLRLDAAEATIEETENVLLQVDKLSVIPLFFSRYKIGLLMFHLAMLEKAIHDDHLSTISLRKKTAIRAVKDAVKTGKRFEPIVTQACRLTGNIYWALQSQRKALRWFNKSIKEGERLGARPDLSRTYFEVGKCLLEPQSKYKHLNGISAEEYLEKARVLFEEMDLKWDLEQLEKVKLDISK